MAVLALPAAAYEVVDVSGGGIIEGRVTYDGSVPTRKIIPTKDQEVCGGIRDEALIVLGPNKGVRDVVVYLKDVESGKAWAVTSTTPELDNRDCVFLPHVQVMPSGSIDIVNSDPVLHNTHGFYGRRTAFNLALPNQHQRITTELTRSGLVRVECDAHGWMLGWIYVADNPYYAVTGADGSFSIPDVPPGDYVLVATQEHTGTVEIPVTVSGGETTEILIELEK